MRGRRREGNAYACKMLPALSYVKEDRLTLIKEDLMSEAEVASILGYKATTLRKNRCLGINHPPFIKIGGLVFYPRKEVMQWIKSFPLKRAMNPS